MSNTYTHIKHVPHMQTSKQHYTCNNTTFILVAIKITRHEISLMSPQTLSFTCSIISMFYMDVLEWGADFEHDTSPDSKRQYQPLEYLHALRRRVFFCSCITTKHKKWKKKKNQTLWQTWFSIRLHSQAHKRR